MLSEKLAEAARLDEKNSDDKESAKANKKTPPEKSFFDNPAVKQAGRTAASIITRSLLGALGISSSSRRRIKDYLGEIDI
jgi:hypothetical protein